ncbi:MAG: phosphatase PAP2 family protein [Elusimicrobiales bacterium]|nr:phosphatase PAP2 family protein [Elusimicrobiales bacterium]
MKISKLLLAAAALLAPAFVSAEEWIIPRTTYYITAEQQKLPDFPAPPKPGSPEDRKDLAAVFDWQQKRTTEQCDKARAAAHADFENFFGDLSPFASPLPEEAAAIFKRVKTETDGIAADIKDKYKRQRPFLRDPVLDPCLGRLGGLAYPSGHATISRLLALLLSDLVPARKKEFLARADEAALDRVIGGVHHPSDIEAGKRLADRLYPLYKKSPAFAADLKTLRGLLVRGKAKVKAGR